MIDPAYAPVLQAIAVLSAFLLIWGGMRTMHLDRTKGVLMIVAALVLVGNVLIWTL